MTCKGTLRQVFVRDYRLEVQSLLLALSTQHCELLPLLPSLWLNSTPPPPPPQYTVYTYTVCKGGGYGVLGLRQINTRRTCKSLYRSFF
jgi:hypothetical protein